MDPCPFVRVLVGNLALRVLRAASKPAWSGVHPSSSPCYCKIHVGGQPFQTAPVTLIPPGGGAFPDGHSLTLAAAFYLSAAQVESLAGKSLFSGGGRPCVRVSVYKGRRGATCGVNSGKLLGRVTVPLDLSGGAGAARPCVVHSGWVPLGKKAKRAKGGRPPSAEVHLTVRADPDPRFVFEFGGEPERSPQVFQVQGCIRQPVFTCKFACRSSCDRSTTSRSVQMETTSSKSWLSSFGPDRERRPPRERKGWSVTVHDLSGSPVALASMVTPFVASPGTDRVSRSNPGAWLILRPGDGTWKPWGRLEAWRERGGGRDGLGYRFELLPDAAVCGAAGVVLAESSLSAAKGGQFSIDLTGNASLRWLGSPGGSPLRQPPGLRDGGDGEGGREAARPPVGGSGRAAGPVHGGRGGVRGAGGGDRPEHGCLPALHPPAQEGAGPATGVAMNKQQEEHKKIALLTALLADPEKKGHLFRTKSSLD